VISILDKAEAQECTWERDHLDWGPFTHPYAACIEAINQIRENGEFPILRGALVQTNTFCETSFGRYPLSVQRINPFIISQDGSISTKL